MTIERLLGLNYVASLAVEIIVFARGLLEALEASGASDEHGQQISVLIDEIDQIRTRTIQAAAALQDMITPGVSDPIEDSSTTTRQIRAGLAELQPFLERLCELLETATAGTALAGAEELKYIISRKEGIVKMQGFSSPIESSLPDVDQ